MSLLCGEFSTAWSLLHPSGVVGGWGTGDSLLQPRRCGLSRVSGRCPTLVGGEPAGVVLAMVFLQGGLGVLQPHVHSPGPVLYGVEVPCSRWRRIGSPPGSSTRASRLERTDSSFTIWAAYCLARRCRCPPPSGLRCPCSGGGHGLPTASMVAYCSTVSQVFSVRMTVCSAIPRHVLGPESHPGADGR